METEKARVRVSVNRKRIVFTANLPNSVRYRYALAHIYTPLTYTMGLSFCSRGMHNSPADQSRADPMRIFTSLIAAVALMFSLLACHPGHEESRRRPLSTGPIRIGFSMDSLQLERWQHDRDAFVARAKELGAEVFVQSADGVDAVQVRQCENLLTQGIDVLVIVPHNGEVMASAVRSAKAQGVPVVSYDRLIRNSDVNLYISFDNKRIGKLQAQYIYDRAKTGNYMLEGGAPTDNNAHLIRDGQMEVLEAAVKRGDIKIVGDQWAKDWLPSEALRHTEDALARV